ALAPRADRLGRGAAADGVVALREGVLHPGRRARDRGRMSDDLEERVRALELQVARLRAAIAGPKFGSPALRPAGRLLWAEGAGYVVWGAVAAVFAVPFAARAVGWTPPSPDAYETIGHLPTPFKL